MKPPIRLASLSKAKVCFVFTHDSVGVGEDGPTHQPVEHLAALRAIPGLHVIRPADANETIHAWRRAVAPRRADGARAQPPEHRGDTDGSAVEHGRRLVRRRRRPPDVVLLGTGSEVAVCVDAAEAARRCRRRAPGSSACRVGPLRGPDRRRSATSVLPPGVPVLSVEAAHARSAGSAGPTTRSASTASAPARPATSCSTSSASTSTTSSSRADRGT